MSDAKSILNVEKEQPGRFPTSRFGGVVWTRLQGTALREIVADEQPEETADPTAEETADPTAEEIEAKFNTGG